LEFGTRGQTVASESRIADGERRFTNRAGRSDNRQIVAEGDLVMVHGRYSGGGRKSLIVVDIFRFDGDQVVEHWDVLQEKVPAENTVAGNPMSTKP
jgi:predicted SnoaL-like aldol condensation-catalyzing enzyme